METTIEKQIDPSKIMQIGLGFWASKTLLTAINMELFTYLSAGELSGKDIQTKLGLHHRNLYDFLDALVALGFLERNGLKETATYRNAEDSALFLDKNKPSYVGGMLEMANNRLYPFWNNLEEGLKTGKPQNETRSGGKPIFEILYRDQALLSEFLGAMGGIQMGNFMALSHRFDFSGYQTLCDLGGAGGYLAAQVAQLNPHMKCISYDLPPVSPLASQNIENMGLAEKVKVLSGDFFKDEIPNTDVITMGNVLHDWGVVEKKRLMKKAYQALPEGGSLVVIENIIDDTRNKNAFGLLMSLNMMIETPEGFDFSFADFNQWAKEVGFKETSIMPLTGPSSAVIAIK
ncbi:methyltransferase family protein [Gillisia sp. Hel_I_86]|uniref:methyltransferase n=1 Tax=Gillisia sp. Hel_I_86 TaxID=1249981 RepID=UPI001199B818|nr:methyltransferase [Gillisia sp. Hel_I_86]TVZ26910.1 methyltransferase family protein [Gillisia sp. Hel_I_86]